MILNEEQLAVEPVLLRTSDLLDTIVDLKHQLRERDALETRQIEERVRAGVQEKVAEAVRDLEHAALDVIEWEDEYRKLNHLGSNPPSPFVRLAICAAKRR